MAKLTKFQEIAKTNITECFNYEVGGWLNCIQDNCEEHIPDSRVDAEKFIYDAAVTNLYKPGYCGSGKAPSQMRFAGKEFMIRLIHQLFDAEDNEIDEIAEAKNWDFEPKKSSKCRPNNLHNRGKKIEYNGKVNTLVGWAKELGIGATTLYARLYYMGWDIDRALTSKKGKATKAMPKEM